MITHGAAAPIIRIRWPKTPNFEFSSDEQVHEFLKKLTKGKRWDLNNLEFDLYLYLALRCGNTDIFYTGECN